MNRYFIEVTSIRGFKTLINVDKITNIVEDVGKGKSTTITIFFSTDDYVIVNTTLDAFKDILRNSSAWN